MTDPQMILHVGAPKCGSSALQTVLSATPDLQDAGGRRYRYTAFRQAGGLHRTLYGTDLALVGQGSAYGYASWPNFRPGEADPALFAALGEMRREGLRAGHVPIASCEGWISRPQDFARHLEQQGYPPTQVVAFLRPPVEWVNAAFWQWGIWHAGTMERWLARGNLHYTFGLDLEAWSRIPNLRLRIGRMRPNVVRRFSGWYGLNLPASDSNTSSPPALIGFLLRNRRFRPNGHDSSAEFVFQRWCPPVPGQRLWAIRAPHVHALRQTVADNLAALMRIATEEQAADLRMDVRWLQEKPYHAAILEGPSVLDDRTELAGLHASLSAGVAAAAQAAQRKMPALPACPAESAPLERWDAALQILMDALLEADRAARQRQIARGPASLRQRVQALVPRLLGRN